MAQEHDNELLTTGEAARICGLSRQTLIRSFDRGDLEGFRVPGSRSRRIPRAALLRFLRAQQVRATGRRPVARRVLLVDPAPERAAERARALQSADLHVDVAGDGFSAGLLTARLRPDVLVVDDSLPGLDVDRITQRLRQGTCFLDIRLTVLREARPGPGPDPPTAADHVDWLRKPVTAEDLAEHIQSMRGTS